MHQQRVASRGQPPGTKLQFRDYDCALRFASLIATIHDFGHHAEICVLHAAGGRLRITVRNLNNAGITQQEFRLASKLDSAIGEHYEWAYGAQPAAAPAEDEALAMRSEHSEESIGRTAEAVGA